MGKAYEHPIVEMFHLMVEQGLLQCSGGGNNISNPPVEDPVPGDLNF